MPRPVLPDQRTVVVVIEPGARAAARAAGRAAPGSQGFRVLRTTQVDGYERPTAVPAQDAAILGRARARAAGDLFKGTARRAAKISISNARMEVFEDLGDLIKSLTADRQMVKLGITSEASSGRVEEEERNVRVSASIYAASREDDNDFHVIIGDDSGTRPLFMNVEVSGLPPAANKHRTRLESVRNRYKRFFTDHPAGLPGTGYDFYDPPIEVTIAGSLFFDITHAKGGKPGPKDLRKNIPTIWEIHPVTELTFRRG